MHFVAIDVETACSAIDSICQVGIVIFQNGAAIGEDESLVDPQCGFDRINIGIHGITAHDVRDAPPFAAVVGSVNACLRGAVVVSHGPFDRNALGAAYHRVGKPMPDCIWLDSIALAKAAWPEQAERGGYKLSLLARRLGIGFTHHDALEDARTAGQIAIAALARLSIDLDTAVRFHGRRAAPAGPTGIAVPPRQRVEAGQFRSITMAEFPGGSGPLAGQRIAFTGTLSITREDAAQMACALGAACSDSISRKTTLLVLGGHSPGEKTGKHVRAERLIAQGATIKIISEAAFRTLCDRGLSAVRPAA